MDDWDEPDWEDLDWPELPAIKAKDLVKHGLVPGAILNMSAYWVHLSILQNNLDELSINGNINNSVVAHN